MFEAKLKTAILKKVVESIKDLVSEASFYCCDTGMSMQGMDSSHVALVSLKMEVDLFEFFRCDRNITVNLKMDDLAKALKYTNNEDACTITVEDDGDTVTFVFRDVDADKTQEVTLKMININEDALQIANLDYQAVCKMPSGEFKKTCAQLTQFTDTINVTATKGGIVFTGKGDSGSSVNTYGPGTNGNEEDGKVHVVVNGGHPLNINFSVQYLNMFTKGACLDNFVTISLCEDAPGAFEYQIEEHGSLCFYLAPKIDDDDEDM